MKEEELLERIESLRKVAAQQCKSSNQADMYQYCQRLTEQMDIIYGLLVDIVANPSSKEQGNGHKTTVIPAYDEQGEVKRKPGRPRTGTA